MGNVQYAVDARGAVSQSQYDAGGRRTNVLVYAQGLGVLVDPSPSTLTVQPTVTASTYDANGNQVTVTDAAGNTTTSHYDDANRVTEVDYPAGSSGTVSRWTYYDGLGRKIQENDEAGVATAYTYDFRGLLTSVTLAYGTTQAVTTVYGYDELGNEITQTDGAGHGTAFQYDALGRRTGRTLPGGQSESFVYDVEGNETNHITFSGTIITNSYDVANRLTNCSGPNYRTIYAYSATGLRTNMVDASGTTAFYYNGLSQLTNKTVTWNAQSPVSLNYGYDALGSLTNLWSSTANGVSNAYQYDLLGRLTNVVANGSNIVNYGFDLVGNLQSLRYANGVTNLYQYDSRNRLTGLAWKSGGTALASFAYTVGPAGNRTALAETVGVSASTLNYAWTYDYLYRMTGETFSGTGYTGPQYLRYGFDAVGNRLSRTSNVTSMNQALIFNANDWQTNTDSYDSNGNTTASATTNYQYDVLNHLTNNGQAIITYDGDGNRVSKKVGSTTTYYLVDDRNPSGYAQVLEEYQGSGLNRVYNYGLALISQRQATNGVVSYYGTDGHGSIRFLTSASGSITDTYTFDAYGLLISSSGATPNNYLYFGQQLDSDLGFYYLRARYYKPDSGRFWTMDTYDGTSEDPLSLHKYVYCKNNPISGIDPGGHDEGDIRVTAATEEVETIGLAAEATEEAAIEGESITLAARLKGILFTVAVLGNLFVPDQLNNMPMDQFDDVQTQVAQRANPTGSQYAYQNFECDTFAADAKRYFRARNRDAQIIRFDAGWHKIKRDEIWATEGLFAGRAISTAAYHEGALVDGIVYDNNFPFGVSRRMWEKYMYLVDPMDKPPNYWIPLRKACEMNYGTITVTP